MKKLIIGFWLLLLVSCFLPTTSVHAQTVTTFETKVIDYQLPYPGLLSDNPLFFVKKLRNQLLLMAAKTPLEKSELNLQNSDKTLAMAPELAKKGKHKLSIAAVKDSNDIFGRIPPQFEKVDPDKKKDSREFLLKVQKANLKHRETIEDLMKDIPQGEVEGLEEEVMKTTEFEKQLQNLLKKVQ